MAVCLLGPVADRPSIVAPEAAPNSSQLASPSVAAANTTAVQTAAVEAQTAVAAPPGTLASLRRSMAVTARTPLAVSNCKKAAYLCNCFYFCDNNKKFY